MSNDYHRLHSEPNAFKEPGPLPPPTNPDGILSDKDVAYWKEQFSHAYFDDHIYAWAFEEPGLPFPPPSAPPEQQTVVGSTSEIAQNSEAITASSDMLSHAHIAENRATTAFSAEDAYHKARLRSAIGLWSITLFACMVLLLTLGKILFNRSVGPYVLINAGMCIIFGVGALVGCIEERPKALLWAQVYFVFLLVLILVGVPVGIYELTNNGSRVERFCQDKGCSGSDAEDLLVLAWVGGVVGLLGWFMIFTAFCRAVFVYACAVERVGLHRNGEALSPLVKTTAYYLPNWPSIWRSVVYQTYLRNRQCSEGAGECCRGMDAERACIGCGVGVCALVFFPCTCVALGSTFGNKIGAVGCFFVWAGFYLAASILCYSEVTSNQIFCYVSFYLEFVLYMLAAIGDSKR